MKKWIILAFCIGTTLMCTAQPVSSSAKQNNTQGRDFFLSLAIPGFSQIRAGRSHGYVMLAAEASIWTSMLLFGGEADLLQEEAYDYALKYAHINPSRYDKQFMQNLGKFNSSGFDADGFNANIRKQALNQFPGDPVAQQAYIDEYSYKEDKYWRWDTANDRSKYNKMRNKSADLENYAKLTVGVMILNHLVSGMDVLIFNSQERRTQLSVGLIGSTPALQASFKF